MGVPEFDDNNFDSEVLQATGPVLVDFGRLVRPCRQIAPVIEQLAGENQERLRSVSSMSMMRRIAQKLRREQAFRR